MILEIIVTYLTFVTAFTNARVYYIDDSNLIKNEGVNVYDNKNNFEQSSRDLDLSFSTGDTSGDNNYPIEGIPIFKRVNPVRPYGYIAHDQPEQYFEINRETDRPTPARTYYKLIEYPEHRAKSEEIIAESKRNPKWTQFNEDRKGEVILEIRVITNNDAV